MRPSSQPGVVLPRYIESDNGEQVTTFATAGEWTAANGTKTADTDNVLIGAGSTKLTHSGSGIGACYVRKAVSLNWGSAPTRYRVYFYVHGPLSELYTVRIQLETSGSDYYQYDILTSANMHLGWNAFEIYPTNWTAIGSPSWSNITQITVGFGPAADGYAPSITFGGIYRNMVNQPVALVSFDDSYASQYTEAFAYMQAKGVRGSSYQIYDYVDGSGRLTTAQLLEMQAAGWTIGSHGNLNWNSNAGAPAEIAACVGFLQGIGITEGWKHCAYPLGSVGSVAYARVMAEGIVSGRDTSTTYFPFVGIGAVNIIRYAGGLQMGNNATLQDMLDYIDACIAANKIISIFGHNLIEGATSTNNDWNIDGFKYVIDYLISLDIPFITAEDLYAAANGPVTVPQATA